MMVSNLKGQIKIRCKPGKKGINTHEEKRKRQVYVSPKPFKACSYPQLQVSNTSDPVQMKTLLHSTLLHAKILDWKENTFLSALIPSSPGWV